MRCPLCGSGRKSQVIDSRPADEGKAIRRRRVCSACKQRFTTYEMVEPPRRLTVVKRDGTRAPFDREKVIAGLEKACYKRAISLEQLRELADTVEQDLLRRYDREVESTTIAQLVADRLRVIDQVAYVRFASVYKQFRDLDDLMADVREIQQRNQVEDRPGQGKLF